MRRQASAENDSVRAQVGIQLKMRTLPSPISPFIMTGEVIYNALEACSTETSCVFQLSNRPIAVSDERPATRMARLPAAWQHLDRHVAQDLRPKLCSQPTAVQKKKARRRRLKGARGRGTVEKERSPIFDLTQRGGQVVLRMLADVY
jgi:hypothetical protein